MRKLQLFVVALLCSITMVCPAQKTEQYYREQFAQIDSLLKQQGLIRSALDKVHLVYGVAKDDKNYGQLLKALQYRMLLQQEIEENSFWKQLNELEEEAKMLPPRATSVLNSILAELYRTYLQVKRYTLTNRTSMATFKPDDYTTWTIEDFQKKITEKFLLSVSEKELLQRTKIDDYNSVIWPGNVQHLRPTLYDLIAHRAIDYFADASREEPANLQHAFSLYLDLISFHSNDASPAALIDVKISQLNFMRNISISANRDSAYISGLLAITEQYPNESEAGMAWYHLADFYKLRAERYSRFADTAYKYDYVTVKQICQAVLALPDSTPAKAMCRAMLWEIMQKDLSFKAEKVNIPGKPFRVLVQYRNVDTLYLKLIKVRPAFHHHLFTWNKNNNWWQWVLDEPVLKTFVQILPGSEDLREHSVEIKMDALPPGEYVLLGSSQKKFELNKDPISLQQFFVSSIAYVNRGLDFFVLDRETGQPINNAKVQVYNSLYNSNSERWVHWKRELFRTDSKGYFRCSEIKETEYGYLTLEITTPGDRLFIGKDEEVRVTTKSGAGETRTSYEEDQRQTYLFTDRSIYRPGQVVWFKGISVTTDFISRKPKIVAGKKTTVFLYDANGSAIDTLYTTTNEYGSFSGRFTLPENTLNGEFHLEETGTVYFRVEEYKRPKFFVSYEKTANTYRINDVVNVAGFAKAYAGNNIAGSTVRYRVVRKSYSSPGFYRIRRADESEKQVAQGETTTDGEGKFHFTFIAAPDPQTGNVDEVMLNYSITCEVTDINGETRTETTSIRASNVTLMLSIDLPAETLPAYSLKQIIINSKNISREFVPSFAHVTVHRLLSPQRLIRQREWDEPDQFIMSRGEYQRNFPYDEYSNEARPRSWQKLEKVIDISDSIRTENAALKIQHLQPGWYCIKAIAYDKYGKPAETESYIQLTGSAGEPASPMYRWEFSENIVAAPKQTVQVHIGSSAKNVFAIGFTDEDVERPGISADKVKYRLLTIDNQQISLPYHVTEAHRGNFIVKFLYVKHNRVYTYSTTVAVPWSNKEAAINYETFRDKSLPGSKETWKVKLSGNKKEKIAAEMLTAMYDAALDEFVPHAWYKPDVWPVYGGGNSWEFENAFEDAVSGEWSYDYYQDYPESFRKNYDILLLGNRIIRNDDGSFRGLTGYYDIESIVGKPRTVQVPDWSVDPDGSRAILKDSIIIGDAPGGMNGAANEIIYSKRGEEVIRDSASGKPRAIYLPENIVRTNLSETAFFFPQLHTDSSGNIEFSFTLPEAVTKWKWIMLAHSKQLAMAYDERTMVTSKQLMVQPNVPRFLREGDTMVLNTKVVNMGDSTVSGMAHIAIVDAATGRAIENWIPAQQSTQNFSLRAGESAVVTFPITLPQNFTRPVAVRFIANAGNISDGEEHTVPVLSNRMMVTETLPLNIRGGGSRNFTFEKLVNSGSSNTLSHHSLILEFTANPAWYAVQSLPYLMEFPYDCSEQLWSRSYANALASKIIRSAPRIDSIFEKWRLSDTTALFSALQKNEELKSALLQETPWVLDAANEREQRKRLALLFDIKKMTRQFDKNIQQLLKRQSNSGGIAWFEGDNDSRFITQYILTGIGRLKKLKVQDVNTNAINNLVNNGIAYLNNKIFQDYEYLLRSKADLSKNHLEPEQVGYLYMISFFPDARQNNSIAAEYFSEQAKHYWLQQNKFMQGMIALALHRQGDAITPKQILTSLKESAIENEEMGMYWKDVTGGYYWYQAPIETQSLLIEAFTEIANDTKTVDGLRTWLLKHKQTHSWSTTKATADACYALLLQGTDWLSTEPVAEIKLGDKMVSSLDQKTEAGSGYFKKVFDAPSVNSSMGNITVNVTEPNGKPATNPSWGAVYWQYFENLETITSAETPLKLSKKLFIERNTDRGLVLIPVEEKSKLKAGDKIKVRIVINVDRDMEFVHMKDMRASCLEPLNVLSEWKWQGGLGYYESTKDASTNFFFSYLPKGTYVFEYPLFVTHTGTFSNGITTIQCMYAPEFSSHSEGVKINVE